MNAPIQHAIDVRCSLEHAFAVFTSRLDTWWPRGHRHLPGAQLTLEGRVGGRFFERGADGREHELGEVTHWEPPHRVAYTWHPGALTKPTSVDVRFSVRPEGTRVEVTHAEGDAEMGEAWPVRAQKFDAAWRHLLPDFASHAEATQPQDASS